MVPEMPFAYASFEIFCVCRICNKSTVFTATSRAGKGINVDDLEGHEGSINELVGLNRYISIRDHAAQSPPKHLPENIESAFKEGATCLAVGCYNAAAAMFRLCLDLATRPLLAKIGEKPNSKTKRNLGLRLAWLFDKGELPESLNDLSTCIKDYGNDGVHEGNLSKEDAEGIFDFTFILLERLYTEPGKLKQAKQRRESRKRKDGDS